MESALPVSLAETRLLFADLTDAPALVLAVSGGPDSIALLLMAARWRAARKRGPALLAVTVDHGLRREAAREALAVKRLARSLGVTHRTLRWTGRKPAAGLPDAARQARYRLLAAAALRSGARHVVTAHTQDDQAETVLMRLSRGSGLSGLAAMTRVSALPAEAAGGVLLLRPLLDLPKARLVATVRAAGHSFADDPTNSDPRFTRARLRQSMAVLGREGLTPSRLALLARRAGRVDEAIEAMVEAAARHLSGGRWPAEGAIHLHGGGFRQLPPEISLRVLGRAVTSRAAEGPVELAKLEALHAAMAANPAAARFRRTLAGALITAQNDTIVIDRAPARRRGRGGQP